MSSREKLQDKQAMKLIAIPTCILSFAFAMLHPFAKERVKNNKFPLLKDLATALQGRLMRSSKPVS
jgi:hypothetical protein